jgi:hypothetical protein
MMAEATFRCQFQQCNNGSNYLPPAGAETVL